MHRNCKDRVLNTGVLELWSEKIRIRKIHQLDVYWAVYQKEILSMRVEVELLE